MICEGKVNIGGFNSERIDGKKIIKSVYLSDIENGNHVEAFVPDDLDLDNEKLAKDLMDYYRMDAVVFVDIQNDPRRPNTNYVNVSFVGIKNE
jgi:hypothetical protein